MVVRMQNTMELLSLPPKIDTRAKEEEAGLQQQAALRPSTVRSGKERASAVSGPRLQLRAGPCRPSPAPRRPVQPGLLPLLQRPAARCCAPASLAL